MKTSHSRKLILPAALVVLGATIVGVAVWRTQQLPKRFAVVAPGRLYRSAELTPPQLERLMRQNGIRRVISLLAADAEETVAERDAAARLGVEWYNIPLRGNGASTPADRDRLRALLADDDAGPTLVHCAAGVNRTGLAVGMYRLHHDGWTLEQVLDELRRHDFEDEPHHQNLREALAAEAALARRPRDP